MMSMTTTKMMVMMMTMMMMTKMKTRLRPQCEDEDEHETSPQDLPRGTGTAPRFWPWNIIRFRGCVIGCWLPIGVRRMIYEYVEDRLVFYFVNGAELKHSSRWGF